MEGIEMKVALGKKFCPYLPPIPVANQLSGKIEAIIATPCGGSMCACFDSCQGIHSPKAKGDRLTAVAKVVCEVARSIPLLSATAKSAIEKLECSLVLPEAEA